MVKLVLANIRTLRELGDAVEKLFSTTGGDKDDDFEDLDPEEPDVIREYDKFDRRILAPLLDIIGRVRASGTWDMGPFREALPGLLKTKVDMAVDKEVDDKLYGPSLGILSSLLVLEDTIPRDDLILCLKLLLRFLGAPADLVYPFWQALQTSLRRINHEVFYGVDPWSFNLSRVGRLPVLEVDHPDETLFALFPDNIEPRSDTDRWPCLRLMMPFQDMPLIPFDLEKQEAVVGLTLYTSLEVLTSQRPGTQRVAHFHLRFPNRIFNGTTDTTDLAWDHPLKAFTYTPTGVVHLMHAALMRSLRFLGTTKVPTGDL